MKPTLTKCLFIVFVSVFSIINGQENSNKDVKSLMSSYYNENFNPFQKSNWFVAFSMSLSDEKFENTTRNFESIKDGEKDFYEFDLRAGYYFSEYFAGSFGVIIGGENFNRKIPKLFGYTDKSSETDLLGISPALRTSIPVVPNQRLNLFVDLGFDFTWGKTKTTETEDEVITYSAISDNYGFGVGIKPGVTFFVMENFALEIGLEILGYNYKSTKTNFDDDTPTEKYASHSIDFDISLTTLQLSLAYYIGVKKDK